MTGDDVQQFVSAQHFAFVIRQDQTIAIAIESHADVGLMLLDFGDQQLGAGGAAALIDVEAVGRSARHDDLRPELLEDPGSDVIGGAVGAVQHHPQPLQTEPPVHGGLAELDVAPSCVGDARCLAQPVRFHADHLQLQMRLDLRFQIVPNLVAVAVEELDAIVAVGIVRGADDDSGIGAQGAGEVGDGRRRHGANQADVGAGGNQAGFQHGFQHVSRNAGVLANDHMAIAAASEDPAGGPAKVQAKLRGNGRAPHGPANAVRAEVLPFHASVRARAPAFSVPPRDGRWAPPALPACCPAPDPRDSDPEAWRRP